MINEHGLGYLLMPIFRIWLYIFFLLVSIFPFSLAYELFYIKDFYDVEQVGFLIVSELCLVVSVVSALLMIFKFVPDIDFYTIFIRKTHLVSNFLSGFGIAFFLVITCALSMYFAGFITFKLVAFSASDILLFTAFIVTVAFFEELLFRTYPLFALAERYPLWFAVAVNGVLYSLGHLANPGITPMAAINVFLAGSVMALYTLQKHNFVGSFGMHVGWLFAQTILFGFSIAGESKIASFVKVVPLKEELLSGGVYGLEASAICGIFLLIVLIALFARGSFRQASMPELAENKNG